MRFGRCPSCPPRPSARSSRRSRRPTSWSRATRARPSRCTSRSWRKLLRAVHGQPSRARATSSSVRRSLHLALQRQLDPQPAAGASDGARVPPQLLPGQARAEEGRGDDSRATPATTSSTTSTTPATSSSSIACCPRRATRMKLQHKYEEEFAHNPSYIEMYRRGNAYHGAHPFFMWYWGETRPPARRARSSWPGAENAHVPALPGLGSRRLADRGHRAWPELRGPVARRSP